MSKTVIASTAFIGAAELIEELGGDPRAIALEAGLLPSVYADPGTVVGGDAFVDFLELAARRCPCPDFGLRHALRWPAMALGPLWLSVRSAASIREAISDFMTHFGVFSDAAGYRLENQGRDLLAYFEPVAAGRWGAGQWVDASLGYLAAFVQAHAGPDWRPPLVHMRHAPPRTELISRTFGPNLVPTQSENAMLFDAEVLAMPITGGNRAARAMLRPAIARSHIHSPNATRNRAESVMRALLPHADCRVDLVASALGVSRRTLQRQLGEAGTSFREILDEARAGVAWRYVTGSNLRFTVVAEMIGFKDQATFTRAFRRWYGVTPRAARKKGGE